MDKSTTGTAAITLSVVAVACWLLSYSWLLGLVLPADVAAAILSEETLARMRVSPWLVAEVVAIPTGLAGAGLGAWAVRRRVDRRRKAIRAAAVAGAVVAVLSFVSLASMP